MSDISVIALRRYDENGRPTGHATITGMFTMELVHVQDMDAPGYLRLGNGAMLRTADVVTAIELERRLVAAGLDGVTGTHGHDTDFRKYRTGWRGAFDVATGTAIPVYFRSLDEACDWQGFLLAQGAARKLRDSEHVRSV